MRENSLRVMFRTVEGVYFSLVLNLLLTLLATNKLGAQTLSPYERITNPEAISILSQPDSLPLFGNAGVGNSNDSDSTDPGYVILGSAIGSGIITHIWTTSPPTDPDSIRSIKVWIDDSLVVSCYLKDFPKLTNGLMRPPLDTMMSGGSVCDVQMPYRRNFRVTFKGSYLFYAVIWKPMEAYGRF